jgi:hypothetical protein
VQARKAQEGSGPERARAQARDAAKAGGSELPPVPITVRQLEAIVRIAESLARMQLQPEATQAHVRHAVDLFRVSTMDAVRSGLMDNLVRPAAPRACRPPPRRLPFDANRLASARAPVAALASLAAKVHAGCPDLLFFRVSIKSFRWHGRM